MFFVLTEETDLHPVFLYIESPVGYLNITEISFLTNAGRYLTIFWFTLTMDTWTSILKA